MNQRFTRGWHISFTPHNDSSNALGCTIHSGSTRPASSHPRPQRLHKSGDHHAEPDSNYQVRLVPGRHPASPPCKFSSFALDEEFYSHSFLFNHGSKHAQHIQNEPVSQARQRAAYANRRDVVQKRVLATDSGFEKIRPQISMDVKPTALSGAAPQRRTRSQTNKSWAGTHQPRNRCRPDAVFCCLSLARCAKK
eukprot:5285667-Amphidinium_carterae.2